MSQQDIYTVYRAPSASGSKDWGVCYHPGDRGITVRWGKSGSVNHVRHYTPIEHQKIRQTEADKQAKKGYRPVGQFAFSGSNWIHPAQAPTAVATASGWQPKTRGAKQQPRTAPESEAVSVDWDKIETSIPSVFF